MRPTPSVSAACTCSRPPYSDKRVVVDCRSAQGPVPKAARLSSLGRSFLRKGHSPSCLPLSLLAFTSPFYSLLSTAPIHFDNPLGLLIQLLSRYRTPQEYQYSVNSDPSTSTNLLVLRDLLFHPYALRLHQP